MKHDTKTTELPPAMKLAVAANQIAAVVPMFMAALLISAHPGSRKGNGHE